MPPSDEAKARKRTSLRLCRTKETPSVGMATWRDARRNTSTSTSSPRWRRLGRSSSLAHGLQLCMAARPLGPVASGSVRHFARPRGATGPDAALEPSASCPAPISRPTRAKAEQSQAADGVTGSRPFRPALDARSRRSWQLRACRMRKCMLLEISRPFLINYERDWQTVPTRVDCPIMNLDLSSFAECYRGRRAREFSASGNSSQHQAVRTQPPDPPPRRATWCFFVRALEWGCTPYTRWREHGAGFSSSLRRIDEMVRASQLADRGEAGVLKAGSVQRYRPARYARSWRITSRHSQRLPYRLPNDLAVSWVAALGTGDVDVAIVAGDARQHGGLSMSLWSERIVVALSSRHPLSNSEAIDWSDLKDETILLSQWDPGSDLRNWFSGSLQHRAAGPRSRHGMPVMKMF